MTQEYSVSNNRDSNKSDEQKIKALINKRSQEKLTQGQLNRMMDYLERRRKGEKLPDFVLNHPMNADEAKNWEYKFWSTQPVPKIGESVGLPGIILKHLKEHYVHQEKMFDPYQWFNLTPMDLDSSSWDDILNFLNKYYKINSKDEFREHFTKDYLRWILGRDYIILGFKVKSEDGPIRFGGLIMASVKQMQIFNMDVPVADTQYLCIHPKLREKQLAPMLIREMTRCMSNRGVIVGYFHAEEYIPVPFCRVEFYNRPLNYERLYNAGFIKLEQNVTLDRAVSTCMISYKNKHKVVKMTDKHYNLVFKLLCEYQNKYNVYRKYSFEEFIDSFADNSCVNSFVILGDDGGVLDFYSYYKLPYFVFKSQKNPKVPNFINAAYMNMYTSVNVTQLTIFKAALLSARDDLMDIFICSDAMENIDVLYDNVSKFSRGSTVLNHHFLNLKCPEISPQQLCL